MASESAVERAREAALAEQAERIAALGPAWRPGVDELREVVEGVLAADAAERARAQRDGIAAARERGVRLGRPRKERPEGYDRIASAVRAAAARKRAFDTENDRFGTAFRESSEKRPPVRAGGLRMPKSLKKLTFLRTLF